MDTIFPGLTDEEHQKLIDAIPLITLLIGSADGKMDDKEKAWAQRVTKFRSYTYSSELRHYYQVVNDEFEDRLRSLADELPEDFEEAITLLKSRLGEADQPLQKLPGDEAYLLYHDFLSFAKHVAKSSGGVLYMANVSPAEKKLLDLDMLTPIENYPGI